MSELISSLGVQFRLYKLEGTLQYTFSREGRPSGEYKLTEGRFGDGMKNEDGINEVAVEGTEISGPGLLLGLVKNDGMITVTFTGTDGASRSWRLLGLEVVSKTPIYKTIMTQTILLSLTDRGAQTDEVAFQTPGVNLGRVSNPPQKKTTENNHTTEVNRKRASGEIFTPNKRIKPSSEKSTWPKFLFMDCCRNTPAFKGNNGGLTIGTEKAEVFWEGWSGGDGNMCFEKRQVDLRAPTLIVTYAQVPTEDGGPIFESISLLKIGARNKSFEAVRDVTEDSMWGNDTGGEDREIIFADPEIFVDALIHCIDMSSQRPPVHDPSAKATYLSKKTNYESLRERELASDDSNDTDLIQMVEGELARLDREKTEWEARVETYRKYTPAKMPRFWDTQTDEGRSSANTKQVFRTRSPVRTAASN